MAIETSSTRRGTIRSGGIPDSGDDQRGIVGTESTRPENTDASSAAPIQTVHQSSEVTSGLIRDIVYSPAGRRTSPSISV